MNLYDVETFQAVATSRSITEAASRLFVSQSTISHRLKSLESELGTTLINRKKGIRSIELTSAGQKFIPLADQWVALWKNTQRLKYEEQDVSLLVGGTDRLNVYMLMPLYKQLADNHTPMHLHIRTQQSTEIYNMVESREIDIGFVGWEMRYKNIVSQPVFCERLVVVCRADSYYPPGPLHPDQLSGRDELYLSCNPEIQTWHEYWWNPSVRPHVSVDTASLIMNFMDQSKFWVLCPMSIAAALQRDSHIEMHELSVPSPQQISYMLTHKIPKMGSVKGIELFGQYLHPFLKTVAWAAETAG